QQSYQLSVSTSGSGTVTTTDHDINCPGLCANAYPVGAPVTLTASAMPGWTFAGWSEACSGTGPCTVTMTQDQSVLATFTRNPDVYNLAVTPSGAGTVTTADGFISCPGTCSHTYAAGSPVTLIDHPGPGGMFLGWGGACSGTSPCNLTITQDLSVTATFNG